MSAHQQEVTAKIVVGGVCRSRVFAAIMFRMNGISRWSTWMCGAIVSDLHWAQKNAAVTRLLQVFHSLFTHDEFLDLAGYRHWEFIHDDDVFRNLVIGNLLVAVIPYRIGIHGLIFT